MTLAKPNFTGGWNLNVSKSSFGAFPTPSSMTMNVSHDDPKLKSSVHESEEKGDWDMDANYTTDGKECTNVFFGNPMKSVLNWDGDALVIDTTGTFSDLEFTSNETWMLSEDGKVLRLTRNFKSAMGNVSQEIVLDKQ